MKKNLKSLVWLSVPVILAVGCAENHHDASVSYSPALTEGYTPTSDTTESRAYPGEPANVTVTAPPQGAANNDWVLAQQVQSLLMSDKTVQTPVTAVVKDGVVTLRGGIRGRHERERLCAEVAKLPGVVRVDDQMHTGPGLQNYPGESQNY